MPEEAERSTLGTLGSREPLLEEPEEMGLLLRFTTREPGEQHKKRNTTGPHRLVQKSSRRMAQSWCEHSLLSVVPIVSIRVEGGYAARCLLCGTKGPVRSSEEEARGMLLEQLVPNED